MTLNASYLPIITIRAAEIKAITKLAGPTKDSIFPVVLLQAWPKAKKTYSSLIQRSLEEYWGAMDDRPAILDLAAPRYDRDTPTLVAGREEIITLASPLGGYKAWVDLISAHKQFIPTLIWGNDVVAQNAQFISLISLGRGLAVRLKRSQGWNIQQLSTLSDVSLENVHVTVILDYGQILPNEVLTFSAAEVQSAAIKAKSILKSNSVTFSLAASSFPSEFASINPTSAKLDIRERQLHNLLKGSPVLLEQGIHLKYGDYASVFAADRLPAFRGAPRVDYPTPLRWLYHRRPNGTFGDAAKAVVGENEWNSDLLCWGAQEIRRAADGDIQGLGSSSPWTPIRINIHLHQQAYFNDGGANVIEEEWND